MSAIVMDADYFIQKFTAIPEEWWIVGEIRDECGRCCAFGHCGELNDDNTPLTAESTALVELLQPLGRVADINDNSPRVYSEPTPRARILAALEWIKKGTSV